MDSFVSEDHFSVYAQLSIISKNGGIITIGSGFPDYKCIDFLEKSSKLEAVVFNNLNPLNQLNISQAIMYVPNELSEKQKDILGNVGFELQQIQKLMIVSVERNETYESLLEFQYAYGLVNQRYLEDLSRYIQDNRDSLEKNVKRT